MIEQAPSPPPVQPEKISILEVAVLRSNINATDKYLKQIVYPSLTHWHITHQSAYLPHDKKCNIRMQIVCEGADEQGVRLGIDGNFLLEFAFEIEDLSDHVTQKEDGGMLVNAILGATLIGLCISTARGLILERTRGSYLGGLILPVQNPMQYLKSTINDSITTLPVSEVEKENVV